MQDDAVRAELLFDGVQQVFVPFDFQFRVQAALHQNLDAAHIHHLLDFLENLLAGERIALVMARYAVEGAELAAHPADVGIVDVAAHHIGDKVVGVRVQAFADMVGKEGEFRQVVMREQAQAVLRRQPFAGKHFVRDVVNAALAYRSGARQLTL